MKAKIKITWNFQSASTSTIDSFPSYKDVQSTMGQRQEHKYNLGHILWHMSNHLFFSIELIRITAIAVLSILLVASFSAFQTLAIFYTHIGTTTSFISSLMSNSMFQRWFSALLIPIVSSTIMEVIALNFFSNVQWSLNSFQGYRLQAKMNSGNMNY